MSTLQWSGEPDSRILRDVGSRGDPLYNVQYRVSGLISEEKWIGDERGATLKGTNGSDLMFLDFVYLSGPRFVQIDHFRLGAGNDILDLTSRKFNYRDVIAHGNQGNDWLLGNTGDDNLFGDAGNDRLKGYGNSDTLHGGSNSDYLDGGARTDRLFGDSGNDIIIGGAGGDSLRGGSGKDTFVYFYARDSGIPARARDTIEDFSLAQRDKINLSTLGDDLQFIGTDAFSGEAGEINYKKQQKDTYIYVDLNGDARADLSIGLNGALNVNENFFDL